MYLKIHIQFLVFIPLDAMESNIVQRLAKILVNTREEDKLDTLGPNYTGPPNDVAEDDSEATDNPDREHKMELTENDKENDPNQKSIDSEVLYERKDSNTVNIDSVNVVQESSESSRLDDQESLMRDLKVCVFGFVTGAPEPKAYKRFL